MPTATESIQNKLTVYNTLTKKKELFQPLDPEHITMYVCGPTVYNYVHIGNARPMVIFDLLFRLLKRIYTNVTYARNITDVDDKINQAAKSNNESISQLSGKYAECFRQDMDQLGVLPPTVEPLATEHINEMIQMINELINKGFAYEAEGHVLFNVAKHSNYGELSNRNLEEMIAGARVEVAPYKTNPADFVLWKPSSADLPGWPSPWGRGRPGWHIECSAMIRKHLGETIDIHGGGQDLIFPHHENEMAQGKCSSPGSNYANYWMHNGYLTTSGEKMSKSLGNFLTVHDLLASYPGETLRYALISAYYRSPLDWGQDTLSQASASLDRLYTALKGYSSTETPLVLPEAIELNNKVEASLLDDLNTPLALSSMHQIANLYFKVNNPKEKQQFQLALAQCGEKLGLLSHTAEEWFTQIKGGNQASLSNTEIEAAIQERIIARKEKRFGDADKIRDDLKQQGIELEDTSNGTKWHRS